MIGADFGLVIVNIAFEIDDENLNSSHESSELFSNDNFQRMGGDTRINPATGLPMTGDSVGGFDIEGNPFGTDLSSNGVSITSSFDAIMTSITCPSPIQPYMFPITLKGQVTYPILTTTPPLVIQGSLYLNGLNQATS
ncbi:hypothetical protein [Marinobacter sp. LV10R520-4]|uniref:hypothetical protein n=1 Tax=Marinobacter sp. LV10R520-4 TaxID=1761796 RepID=UPI0011815A03|nr:hypothetical protein [Marinobacter sp. LV10R520-4]